MSRLSAVFNAPHELCVNQRQASGVQGVWSEDEHDRFLEAMKMFPRGPWKEIAAHVGTRSVRQVQTHAQKYCEKVERHTRGLIKERRRLLRPEHRLDEDPGCYLGGGVSTTSNSVVADAQTPPARISFEMTACKMEQQPPRDLQRESTARALLESGEERDTDSAVWRRDDADESDRTISMIDLDDYCLNILTRVLEVDDCASERIV